MDYESCLQVLRAMQVPCTSTLARNSVWDRTDRLEKILGLAGGYCSKAGDVSLLFSRVPFEELKNFQHIILLSSHADTVPRKQFLSVFERSGLLTGTFDNTATNAALVVLMQENILPDNVVYAFTGDEETGRCAGAVEAIYTLASLGCDLKPHGKVHPFALDMTYEGYGASVAGKQVSFTLEGVGPGDEQVVSVAEELASEGNPYLCVPCRYFPEGVSLSHRAKHIAMFDEGAAYRELVGRGCSLCLPCGNGDMHSGKGVDMQASVYVSYVGMLASIVSRYERHLEEGFRQGSPVLL